MRVEEKQLISYLSSSSKTTTKNDTVLFPNISPANVLPLPCLYLQTGAKMVLDHYFFPFIGSLAYLYHTFYSRRNIDNLTEEVKTVFVSNYKIDKLEKQLTYSDTVTNKILLAEEHTLAGNYRRALELYKSCLHGLHEDDPKILIKILENSYLLKDYESVIEYGKRLKDDPLFADSEERISLAWAYYEIGIMNDSEHHFMAMDKRFSNYEHRLAYARFLALTDSPVASKEKLKVLLDEIDAMDAYEKRLKKAVHQKIKYQYQQRT